MKKNLKKLISTVAALAIAVSCVPAFAADFTDVADTADYKVAVDNIVALGIAQGNPDGTFAPENLIKRSEASKMIVGTMGPAMMSAAESSKGATGFSDVPAEHWASGYIVQGVSKGYINGMGDGTFAPDANVTFGQVVKMLVCVLGYGDDAENAGGWLGGGYLDKAASLGVSDGFDSYPADKAVNRGEVAMLINNSLDIPVKAIVDYDTGFELDADGNLKTVVVPVLKPMNGKNGYDYETLLTTYFNAYAVRGRIEDQNKVEGTVEYVIEFSENFDGDKVEAYKDKNNEVQGTVTEDVIYPEGLDIDSLFFSYTDAIIMENEDGDWELVSVASYGRNEVETLSSELYESVSFEKDKEVINFYRSLDTAKKDDYDLDPNVEVFVNGTKAKDRAGALSKYVANNKTTEVKLIDTPKATEKSPDGAVDYIMLSVYTSAVVSSVAVDEAGAEIYIKSYDTDLLGEDVAFAIDFDEVEEGKQEYAIVDTEGNDVAVADLKKNDVVTIYGDFEGTLDESFFMVVSTETVEGQVSGKKENNNKKGTYTYTVAGEAYTKAHTKVTGAIEVGDSYTFYVDMFGRIVMIDTLASSVNYGIINRVYESSTGDQIVRMVNTDGEIVSYVAKDAEAFEAAEKLYKKSFTTYKEPDVEDNPDTKENEYEVAVAKALKEVNTATDKINDFDKAYGYLVVTYKLNAKDQIHEVKPAGAEKPLKKEFDGEDVEIGNVELSDATKVVDMTDAKATWNGSISSLVSAGSADSFVDGVEYEVIAVGEEFTDGSTPFVIVISGESAITATTAFAVVKSTGRGISEADGITYDTIECLQDGEVKVLYTAEEKHGLEVGDVFVYSLDNDGLAADISELYSANEMSLAKIEENKDYTTSTKEAVEGVEYKHETYLNVKKLEKYNNFKDVWKSVTANDDEYTRIGVGALVENTGSKLVIGKVVIGADTKVDAVKDSKNYFTIVEETSKVKLADDANVYVYDLRKGKFAEPAKGTEGNLVPTVVAEDKIYENTEGKDVYEWTKGAAKTVFYQTYEDEITNILIVIPA